MPIGYDYTPKYIELDDVPIVGPDDYTDSEKRKAIFQGETELELDVNGGDTIASGSVTDHHELAVMNLATHVLTGTAEEPSDVTLGDLADGGTAIENYSSKYLETYNRLIDKIQSSDGDTDTPNFSKAVNKGSSDRTEGAEEKLY